MWPTKKLGSGSEARVFEVLGDSDAVVKIFRFPKCWGLLTPGKSGDDISDWVYINDNIVDVYYEQRKILEFSKERILNVNPGTVEEFVCARGPNAKYLPPIVLVRTIEQTVFQPSPFQTQFAVGPSVLSRPKHGQTVYLREDESLVEYLERVDVETAKKVIGSVFKTLILWHFLHGFSHGDLSASNVMVTLGQAAILDFGFATIRDADGDVLERADYPYCRPEFDFGKKEFHPVRDFIELCESLLHRVKNKPLKRWLQTFVQKSWFTKSGYVKVPMAEILNV